VTVFTSIISLDDTDCELQTTLLSKGRKEGKKEKERTEERKKERKEEKERKK
jgi:hypothetical protein